MYHEDPFCLFSFLQNNQRAAKDVIASVIFLVILSRLLFEAMVQPDLYTLIVSVG